jgi:hypothetical protein
MLLAVADTYGLPVATTCISKVKKKHTVFLGKNEIEVNEATKEYR